MARRGVKKREHEKLSPANIRRVASLLADDKPITKKEACELLNISYNTKRLQSIIDEQTEKDERQVRRRKANRGKPATDSEILAVVQDTLEGDPIKDIADRLARPSSFIKNILARVGVPEKAKGEQKYKTLMLPEACVASTFKPEEVAWSAQHNAPVIIKKDLGDKYEKLYECRCYQIWVNQAIKRDPNKDYFVHSTHGGFNAFIPAYDLGKLDHLTKLGANVRLEGP